MIKIRPVWTRLDELNEVSYTIIGANLPSKSTTSAMFTINSAPALSNTQIVSLILSHLYIHYYIICAVRWCTNKHPGLVVADGRKYKAAQIAPSDLCSNSKLGYESAVLLLVRLVYITQVFSNAIA